MDPRTFDAIDDLSLHLLLDEPGAAWEKITYPLRDSGKVVRAVRGQKMRTLQGLFDEFGAALQFPDYFGENRPALRDCLTDLDWLGDEVPGYVVIVRHASQLLADERAEAFDWTIDLFRGVAEEWAKPVADGEWWDRPGRPFHVVLQESPDRGEALLARLRTSGVPVGGVWRSP